MRQSLCFGRTALRRATAGGLNPKALSSVPRAARTRPRPPAAAAAAAAAGFAGIAGVLVLGSGGPSVASACLDCLGPPSEDTVEAQEWVANQRPISLKRSWWGASVAESAASDQRGNAGGGYEAPVDPAGHLAARKELISTAIEMNKSGLNQGTSGNLSVRVPGGFLITPSGMPYETMTPDQVVYMDMDGGYYGEKAPSSEWRFHYDIYVKMPKTKAILHAHPTYCTAVAVQNRDIPAFHYMVAVANGKKIPCAPYYTFGTQKLSNAIINTLRSDPENCIGGSFGACLMANHGVVVLGSALPKVFKVAFEVECLAKQYCITLAFGKPDILPNSEMDAILSRFRTYGLQVAELKALVEGRNEARKAEIDAGPGHKVQWQHSIVHPPKRETPRSSPSSPVWSSGAVTRAVHTAVHTADRSSDGGGAGAALGWGIGIGGFVGTSIYLAQKLSGG